MYPVAGERVAAELEKVNYSEFPNTWEWIGRIDKLRQELEVCGKWKYSKQSCGFIDVIWLIAWIWSGKGNKIMLPVFGELV